MTRYHQGIYLACFKSKTILCTKCLDISLDKILCYQNTLPEISFDFVIIISETYGEDLKDQMTSLSDYMDKHIVLRKWAHKKENQDLSPANNRKVRQFLKVTSICIIYICNQYITATSHQKMAKQGWPYLVWSLWSIWQSGYITEVI